MFMMRFLIFLLSFIAFTPLIKSQTLISYTLLKSFSKAQVDSLLSANGIPPIVVNTKYGVDMYKVLYRTPYKHPDSLVQASGLAVIPKNTPCGVPLAIWGHGTESRVMTAASMLTGGQWEIGVGFGATGYVVTLPDYLGMGFKDPKVIIHPYQHAYHEAQTSVNMLRATRELCTAVSGDLNGQLFLFGYSQGGYVTMATAKEIQTNLSNEFTITAAAPMSGSYDLDGAQYEMIKSDSVYATPGYLPFLTLGYNSVLGTLFNDPSDVFKAPYDTTIPPKLYSGNFSIGQINNISNPVPKKMFKDSIVNAIFSDSLHPFRVALRDNNLVKGWVPQFLTRLYYCTGDEQVTYLNSEVAYNTWTNAGATSLQKRNFGSFGHFECAQYTVLDAKNFFDSLRIECTNSIQDVNNKAEFGIYPNPAKQTINIKLNALENTASATIHGADGAIVNSLNIKDKLTSFDIASLPAGIYLVRVINGQTIRSKSFIKE